MEFKLLCLKSKKEFLIRKDVPLVLGRGDEIGCLDKRVSRRHAELYLSSDEMELILYSLHTNPCFVMKAGLPPVSLVKRFGKVTLKVGDYIALLPNPDATWYEVLLNDHAPSPQPSVNECKSANLPGIPDNLMPSCSRGLLSAGQLLPEPGEDPPPPGNERESENLPGTPDNVVPSCSRGLLSAGQLLPEPDEDPPPPGNERESENLPGTPDNVVPSCSRGLLSALQLLPEPGEDPPPPGNERESENLPGTPDNVVPSCSRGPLSAGQLLPEPGEDPPPPGNERESENLPGTPDNVVPSCSRGPLSAGQLLPEPDEDPPPPGNECESENLPGNLMPSRSPGPLFAEDFGMFFDFVFQQQQQQQPSSPSYLPSESPLREDRTPASSSTCQIKSPVTGMDTTISSPDVRPPSPRESSLGGANAMVSALRVRKLPLNVDDNDHEQPTKKPTLWNVSLPSSQSATTSMQALPEKETEESASTNVDSMERATNHNSGVEPQINDLISVPIAPSDTHAPMTVIKAEPGQSLPSGTACQPERTPWWWRSRNLVINTHDEQEPERSSAAVLQNIPTNAVQVKVEAGVANVAGIQPPDPPNRGPVRPLCQYEGSCYRRNALHKSGFSHPGDQDWVPMERRPICPYGAHCYRQNQGHRVSHQHPAAARPVPPLLTPPLSSEDYDDDSITESDSDEF